MNTPVSFEIAKLLKEKGFKSESAVLYDSSGELFYYRHSNNEMQRFRYEAPTIVEVVMWLYEKYKIWVRVNSMDGEVFFFDIWCFGKEANTALTDDAQIIMEDDLKWNSPTETYSAAIEYTLNHLL